MPHPYAPGLEGRTVTVQAARMCHSKARSHALSEAEGGKESLQLEQIPF